ncbi:MAG: tRNA adenosine(34) deaminase TadA [Gammaproteobacteria bacterium]|nr:MAG: tRNA adenosine(34) deaminase TadA [Gammaproteobacteria bacterium]
MGGLTPLRSLIKIDEEEYDFITAWAKLRQYRLFLLVDNRVGVAVEPSLADHEKWMRRALALADRAANEGEVPVGAVVVRDGQLLGEGWNQVIGAHDPTAHAEIIALRDAAGSVANYRLSGATVYVTLEPCTMCAGAMVHARIAQLVFGAEEPKAGVICSTCNLLDEPWFNHRVSWRGGVLAADSSSRLQAFFQVRR